MANLSVASLPPPVNGVDTTSSPGTMPEGFAPQVKNLLVHRQGLLTMRGPIADDIGSVIGDSNIIGGWWTFNENHLISLVVKSATAVYEPWFVPFFMPTDSATLAGVSTNMKTISAAGTVNTLAASPDDDVMIGGRGVRLGKFVYGLGYQSEALAATDEGYPQIFNRKILRWNGGIGVGGNPVAYDNAPEGGMDVCAHLNRLWVLGGQDVPGGSPDQIDLSTLYFSDNEGPTTDSADMWKDNVSSLVNKIVVDNNNPEDYGVGLGKQGQNLVIFKRNSVHVLYGHSPQTFTLRPLTNELGCVDQRSIVEDNGVIYWASESGFHAFDGNEITHLHRSVEATLLPAIAKTVGREAQPGGRAVAMKLPNDYLMLSVSQQDFALGVQKSDPAPFGALLHTPTGRWTHFDSDATDTLVPVHLIKTALETFYMSDGTNVIQVPYLTQPELADSEDRGIDFVDAAQAARDQLMSNPEFNPGLGSWTAPGDPPDWAQVDLAAGDGPLPSIVDCAAITVGAVEDIQQTMTQDVSLTTGTQYTLSAYVRNTKAAPGDTLSTKIEVLDPSDVSVDSYLDASHGDWHRRRVTFETDATGVYTIQVTGTVIPDEASGGIRGVAVTGFLLEEGGLKPYTETDILAAVSRTARINSVLHHPILPLATPAEMSQMHRVLIDHSFQMDDPDDIDTGGWYVSVVGGDGRVIQAEYQVDAAQVVEELYRQRHVVDCHNEAPDAQVRIEWKDVGDDTYPAVARAELYESHLEHQVTRQKRST